MIWPSVALGLTLLLVTYCEAFYLPGLAPVTYCDKPTEVGQCTVSSVFFKQSI